MAKQQPSTDMVRFQLSQFPDLMPLADRVGADGEGRGGLVREVRRLVRLGMALESVGIGSREIQALMDGALQLVPTGVRGGLLAPQSVAPQIPDVAPPAARLAHAIGAVRRDDKSTLDPAVEESPAAFRHPAPARVASPGASPAAAVPVDDPVLDAFIV